MWRLLGRRWYAATLAVMIAAASQVLPGTPVRAGSDEPPGSETAAKTPPASTSTPKKSHANPVEAKNMGAKIERPSAERVARRAIMLSLVMYRASLEHFPGEAKYEALHRRLPEWIDRLGLAAELEKEEREFLHLPLGKADEKVRRNASWRNEGLGVLAWALNCFELPPYDQQVDPREAGADVGFSEDLLAAVDAAAAQKLYRSAALRPAAEIDRFASHITIVHWRLRQFQREQPGGTTAEPAPPAAFPFGRGIGQRMDFVGYLRAHPSFRENWLSDLRFLNGDLAIGHKSIADAPPDQVETCASIATERQIAAYWLQGDESVYSHVDSATLLSALGDEARAADRRKAIREHQTEKATEAYKQGQAHSEKGEFDQAIIKYTQAIQADANFGPAYFERAGAYLATEQHEWAIADFTAVIQLDVKTPLARFGRGEVYAAQGEYDKAIADYTEAIRLDPDMASAYLRRGVAYGLKQAVDQAIADFTAAIRLDSKCTLAYLGRGETYSIQKKYAQALADYQEAVRLDPESVEAHNALAWLRATCPDARLRDGTKAVAHAQMACKLTDWKDPCYFDSLAAAYAELGNFDEAVKWEKKAIASPDYPQEDIEEARSRLQLYEQKKPFRED